tara:strand:- start:53 stop:523 length:471 start_codon:yes stop_codon:yes gene_type:complete
MAVPNTTTFSLNDVRLELGLGATSDLIACIAAAVAGQYDPAYYTAPATSLLEFRNYGAVVVANTLTISPTSVSRSSAAFNITITVTSNTSWTVSDNALWTTFSPSTGSGNGSISVSGTTNTGIARFSTITVTTSAGSPSIVRNCVIEQLSAGGGGA